MQKFILSIDQGSTSTRSIIFNKKFEIVSYDQLEFKQFYPKDGFVEHDPDEIFNSVLKTSNNVIKKANSKLIWFHAASIGELKSIIPIMNQLNENSSSFNFFELPMKALGISGNSSSSLEVMTSSAFTTSITTLQNPSFS